MVCSWRISEELIRAGNVCKVAGRDALRSQTGLEERYSVSRSKRDNADGCPTMPDGFDVLQGPRCRNSIGI
jgi:hypothetical protein